VPLMLAELPGRSRPGPKGIISGFVNGDKEAVDAILHHPFIQSVGFVGFHPDRPNTSMHGAVRKLVSGFSAFGGAKNHMSSCQGRRSGQAADALIGRGLCACGRTLHGAFSRSPCLWATKPPTV